MESSEQGVAEFQGFQMIDSVKIYRTPEKLTSVIHLKEVLDTFSEISLAESYVVGVCGISYVYWSKIYVHAIWIRGPS